MRLRKVLATVCLATAFSVLARGGEPASIEEKDGLVTLRGEGAEYQFDPARFYFLKSCSYNGQALWARDLGFTYSTLDDRWFWEEKEPHRDYKIDKYEHKIVKEKGAVSLEVTAVGKQIRVLKSFSMRDGSPALRVRRTIEFLGPRNIQACGLGSTPIPEDKQFFRVENVIENGKVVQKIQLYPLSYFKDLPEHPYWTDGLPLIGSYDPQARIGFAIVLSQNDNAIALRGGKGNVDGFIGASIWYPDTEKDKNGKERMLLETDFEISPFSGEPSQLEKPLVEPLFAWLRKNNQAFSKNPAGALLVKNDDFALWTELSANKVFRDEALPVKTSDQVAISAASGEYESFQLILKPLKDMSEVSLRISELKSGDNLIGLDNLKWNPVEYKKGATANMANQVLGEMPDTLLDLDKIDCRGGLNQPFWVTVRVPPKTPPGVYQGMVEIASAGKTIGAVPLKLKVWNFDIAEQHTLTAAFDFWDFPAHRAGHQKAIEKMVVERRGGARWVDSPQFSFDDDGNLKSIDFAKFDAAAEKFLGTYKHKVLITRCFMLGYGHIPRKGVFGSEYDVMSPIWQKKVIAVAKALDAHLKEKGWNDKIVIDLFDEPKIEYVSMINAMVMLLRTVDPTWRFTYAGSYVPQLSGSINFWNVGWSQGESIRETVRKETGSSFSVYNPPGYAYNSSAAGVRADYWYLRHANIEYVYQWLINTWGELVNEGLSDNSRIASWVAPSKNGPLSTIRFDVTRDGIEDYEYLTLLQKLIPAMKAKGENILAERGEKLLARIPETFSVTKNTDWFGKVARPTNDAVLIHSLRDEVGGLLDEMSAKAGTGK